MNKIEEIFRAWGIALNPNSHQFELAKKRLEICEGCEHKRDNPVKHCSVCGCALKAKIYSPVIGACPEGKWTNTDIAYKKKGVVRVSKDGSNVG